MDESINLNERYNYDQFTREKVFPWMRFDQSPPLGQQAPDFPLWDLEEQETRLSSILNGSAYTIVEFGSFT